MSDNVNIKLDDEMLFSATAGLSGDLQGPMDFDATGTVTWHMGGGQYQVRCDDGAELIAENVTSSPVPEGAKVGLFAIHGGWTMKMI